MVIKENITFAVWEIVSSSIFDAFCVERKRALIVCIFYLVVDLNVVLIFPY